ncbi:hypothetical protein NDN08_006319 [Rhodosorus marinus]|uniref:Enoyl-CoA hydratase n=1 Tax=Rhodosorus marinus TaxID=101924 RepID=A0AAV8UKE4_9RHOD|nr:hypothetical protein NDN08_006319 [Rhodosorus marinus]
MNRTSALIERRRAFGRGLKNLRGVKTDNKQELLKATSANDSLFDRGSKLWVGEHSGSESGIASISLENASTRNALSREVIGRLRDAVNLLNDSPGIRVVVIQSLVDGVFCAGADLKERAKLTLEQQGDTVNTLRTNLDALSKCRVPTVAAMDGPALGGGAELALACDFRIASQRTVIGFPECKLGIIPGAGGTQRLSRLIGPSRAKELIFTGRRVSAGEALEIGLIDKVDDAEDVVAAAKSFTSDILKCAPLAISLAKRAIDEGLDRSIGDGLEWEGQLYAETLHTLDRAEGVRAFNEKRRPVFQGR